MTKLVPRKLLLEADNDPELKGFVNPDSEVCREPIYSQRDVVGFFTPRRDPDGIWRTGAIWIKPKFRGKGVASKAIADFMRGKRGRAMIEHHNVSSQKAFSKAGFTKMFESKDGTGYWWQNF